MLVTPEYCRLMARYNAWQNTGLRRMVAAMDPAELSADRGAFFGSIMATLNHLLWADQVWLHRLAGHPAPDCGIAQSVALTPTAAVWGAERFRTDGRLTLWAEGVRAVDLLGNLTWQSGAAGRQVSRPVGLLVAHLFNHQTHHRGQVHAMLTAAGQRPGDTDLFLMPEA
ncbi:MAG: damage-inducible protein DinB [Rhodobacterales bacterium]|nr:damage-inducible protein DinB [Rhodobacterales bacterium]